MHYKYRVTAVDRDGQVWVAIDTSSLVFAWMLENELDKTGLIVTIDGL